jgi:hypothetical protein
MAGSSWAAVGLGRGTAQYRLPGARHPVAVRSLGNCRYEVTIDDPQMWDSWVAIQVFYSDLSEGATYMLWNLWEGEDVCDETNIGAVTAFWFLESIDLPDTATIGLCPCTCDRVGSNPVLVIEGCLSPWLGP